MTEHQLATLKRLAPDLGWAHSYPRLVRISLCERIEAAENASWNNPTEETRDWLRDARKLLTELGEG
jgi:hypothetical protein